MIIFKQEFKSNFKSCMIWSFSVSILILMFMSFYTSFSKNAEAFNMIMANYPKAMLEAFGMSGVNLSEVAGYFTFTFLFVQICLAIQASNYGFAVLSLEERERTADFLMVKPVKRISIITSKLLAAVSILTITNIVVWISTFAFVELFRDGKTYDINIFLKMLSCIILFQLFFLAVGMVISVSVKKIGSVLSYSMSLSFGLYIVSAFGSIIGEKKLAYITPFKYFEMNYLVINGHYDRFMIFLCAGIITVSLVASYILYIKRNIHSAS
ncbi:MAG: ABC transporter permease subunit [Clostridia bacterium]|nr:ABC transporter permease subunit [Clostridia bacterium]